MFFKGYSEQKQNRYANLENKERVNGARAEIIMWEYQHATYSPKSTIYNIFRTFAKKQIQMILERGTPREERERATIKEEISCVTLKFTEYNTKQKD